ncbi:uncharacterized protein METZ01_LOCUS348949 [marine metagenome]|uniref:Uncharacterized protein n=1 Tax=marine metagenome TaxID=408172 RepID=A0A382RFZ3_9ZZZZ
MQFSTDLWKVHFLKKWTSTIFFPNNRVFLPLYADHRLLWLAFGGHGA